MVAVTGATGFIGRHVVAALRRVGHPVRALVRPGRAIPDAAGVEIIPGTLADPAALERLLGGAGVLVNCAGSVRGAVRADFATVNEHLLVALLRGAGQAGVRVVHLSSLAARVPALSDYASSKAAGEALIAASGLRYTVLRPCAVYGPGDVELRPLLQGLHRGLALVPGVAGGRFSLLYVEDLAEAACRAVDSPPTGTCHELDDGAPQGHDWPGVAAAMARVTGHAVRAVRVPAALLRAAGVVGAGGARVLGRAPMLTPGKVRELLHPDWVVRDHSLTDAIGWQARVGLDEGLRRTFAAR